MSAKGADPGAGDSGAAGSTGEPRYSHERNARRNRVPPPPKKPKPTQRRQFKLWMILCLQSAGAELDLDSPYGDIQKALQKFEPFKPNADEGGAS